MDGESKNWRLCDCSEGMTREIVERAILNLKNCPMTANNWVVQLGRVSENPIRGVETISICDMLEALIASDPYLFRGHGLLQVMPAQFEPRAWCGLACQSKDERFCLQPFFSSDDGRKLVNPDEVMRAVIEFLVRPWLVRPELCCSKH